MRRVVVANQKGGVGKSTLVLNLARALADMEKLALVVDCDPQSNATAGLLGAKEPSPTLYNIFCGEAKTADTIIQIQSRIHLLPSDIALASADIQFGQELGRENKLKKALARLEYDFILIDTPPSLGLMTINALMAAEEIIIPISASFWALRGIELLEDTIEKVRIQLDHDLLRILGAVATMMDRVTNVSRDAMEIARDHFKGRMFEVAIPKTVRVEEANSRSLSIFDHDPKSPAAEAYRALALEVLRRGTTRRA